MGWRPSGTGKISAGIFDLVDGDTHTNREVGVARRGGGGKNAKLLECLGAAEEVGRRGVIMCTGES